MEHHPYQQPEQSGVEETRISRLESSNAIKSSISKETSQKESQRQKQDQDFATRQSRSRTRSMSMKQIIASTVARRWHSNILLCFTLLLLILAISSFVCAKRISNSSG